jgi:hypothetical protein
MLLFALFAGHSLLLILQGAQSCGCFGAVEVNPVWTLLVDLFVLIGLAIEHITSLSRKSNSVHCGKFALPTAWLAISIATTSVATTITLLWWTTPPQPNARGMIYTSEGLVILTPEKWIDQRFPLLDEIDPDVSRGEWVLLLHRHDCPRCQEAVPKYQQKARDDATRQIAIVEMPPYSNKDALDASPCRNGRLSDKQEWFVETPLELRLQDGVVLDASTELPFIIER